MTVGVFRYTKYSYIADMGLIGKIIRAPWFILSWMIGSVFYAIKLGWVAAKIDANEAFSPTDEA